MSNATQDLGTAQEIINIEEYSKRGETPPRARRYVIRIDKQNYTVSVDHMTGRHRTSQNPWRPGIDDVAGHLVLVDDWLAREFVRRCA